MIIMRNTMIILKYYKINTRNTIIQENTNIPFILFNMKLDLPELVATATYHVILHRKP